MGSETLKFSLTMKKIFIISSSIASNLHFILFLSIGLYTLFLLSFNVSRGLDITDESFYILWAQYPYDIFATVHSFGFYTGILYRLCGENLAFFRLAGIFILVLVSFFFSKELYQYVLNFTKTKFSKKNLLLFTLPITISSLAYYMLWLITPSYNWLNLIGILLLSTGLIRYVNLHNIVSMTSCRCSANILISFGSALVFYSKPSSAIMLFIIILFWLLVHSGYIRWKSFIFINLLFVIIILNIHVLVFERGYIEYYNKIIDGMMVLKLLGAGHTIQDAVEKFQIMVVEDTFKKFYIFKNNYLMGYYFIGLSFLILSLNNTYISKSKIIVRIFLAIFLINYAYFLYDRVLSVGVGNFYLWRCVFELVIMMLIIDILTKRFDEHNYKQSLNVIKIIFIVFFLNALSVSYSFGTGNRLVYSMSGSVIFSIASLTFIAYLIDGRYRQKIFLIVTAFISLLYILFIVNHAYKNPYRLIHKISEQNVKVSLSVNNNKKNIIYVDTKTANYFNELRKAALLNGWNAGSILIDLTGASPGANVILNAKFIGSPWLLGGYPGSELFAYAMLSGGSAKKLKHAWVLTAPQGRRKISLNTLNKLGLDFPNGYEKVGSFTTGYRNEVQELWKVRD